MDWTKRTARQDEEHFNFGSWRHLWYKFDGNFQLQQEFNLTLTIDHSSVAKKRHSPAIRIFFITCTGGHNISWTILWTFSFRVSWRRNNSTSSLDSPYKNRSLFRWSMKSIIALWIHYSKCFKIILCAKVFSSYTIILTTATALIWYEVICIVPQFMSTRASYYSIQLIYLPVFFRIAAFARENDPMEIN